MYLFVIKTVGLPTATGYYKGKTMKALTLRIKLETQKHISKSVRLNSTGPANIHL